MRETPELNCRDFLGHAKQKLLYRNSEMHNQLYWKLNFILDSLNLLKG